MDIYLEKEQFFLSHLKAMVWKRKKIILIADAHFSKEIHFRKNGINAPLGILQNDLQRLNTLIAEHNPEEIIFLGDMFHSVVNAGMKEFEFWRNSVAHIRLTLILGNHDILNENWYIHNGIHLKKDFLVIDNFILSHDKLLHDHAPAYNLHGHIHPGVVIQGQARQSITVPCFIFEKTFGILPAFGRFTGCVSLKKNKTSQIFAIADTTILKLY